MEAAKNSVGFLDLQHNFEIAVGLSIYISEHQIHIYSYFVYLCCAYSYFVVKTAICTA